MMKNDEKKEML